MYVARMINVCCLFSDSEHYYSASDHSDDDVDEWAK